MQSKLVGSMELVLHVDEPFWSWVAHADMCPQRGAAERHCTPAPADVRNRNSVQESCVPELVEYEHEDLICEI